MELCNVIVVDTETTGTNPFVHDLLSVAFVPLKRGMPTLELFIDVPPDVKWTTFASENFKNFEKEWRKNVMSPAEAGQKTIEYFRGLGLVDKPILAGHNVGFDRAFLQKLAITSGQDAAFGVSHRNIDTHTLIAMLVLGEVLPAEAVTSTGAFNHFGIDIPHGKRHTALGDAIATRELIEKLLEIYQSRCDFSLL